MTARKYSFKGEINTVLKTDLFMNFFQIVIIISEMESKPTHQSSRTCVYTYFINISSFSEMC